MSPIQSHPIPCPQARTTTGSGDVLSYRMVPPRTVTFPAQTSEPNTTVHVHLVGCCVFSFPSNTNLLRSRVHLHDDVLDVLHAERWERRLSIPLHQNAPFRILREVQRQKLLAHGCTAALAIWARKSSDRHNRVNHAVSTQAFAQVVCISSSTILSSVLRVHDDNDNTHVSHLHVGPIFLTRGQNRTG